MGGESGGGGGIEIYKCESSDHSSIQFINCKNDDQTAFIEAETIVNATLGKDVTLTCTVHNLKNYKIAWYHNGILLTLDTIRIYDDERYTIENTKLNEWKLLINGIDLNDDGHYSCRLSNGLKKIIHLKVGVPPKFTSNDSIHQVYLNVNEHENLTLSCEASGNPMPVIHWYRKNKHISTGVNLHLKNLTRQHTHFEYECVARNNVPPDASRHFKININFEPIVNLMYHFQTYLNVAVDDDNVIRDDRSSVRNLEFVCEVYGNPLYSINWVKDGEKLKEITNFVNFNYANSYDKSKSKMLSITTNEIKTYKYLTRLQIKNVDEKDNGLYECIVNSMHGNISKAVVVNDVKPVDVLPATLQINKNKKHKSTTTTAKNLENNIIELNLDEEEEGAAQGGGSLVFNIRQREHENSLEANAAFISNRGTRSNSTNNRYYQQQDGLTENNSIRHCLKPHLIILALYSLFI